MRGTLGSKEGGRCYFLNFMDGGGFVYVGMLASDDREFIEQARFLSECRQPAQDGTGIL